MIADPTEYRRLRAQIEREMGRDAFEAALDDWRGER